MSEYKGIKGFQVTTRTEDPVPYAQALADNPYGGVWSSGGGLNTGRESAGTSGTLTAGLYAGGYNITGKVEKYDGSSWTEVSDLNTGRRQLKAAGTSNTANIVFGGDTSGNATGLVANTESWDNSSWTEVADLNSARSRMVGSQYGSSTAAIAAGGSLPSPSFSAITESWNGSSWTEVADLSTVRRLSFGSGTTGVGQLSFAEVSGGTSYQAVKTSGFTAVAGEGYFCNTTSAAFTATLPSSGTIGDEITFIDYAGTFDTNNLTIGRNSHNIQGSAADLTVSTERAGITLVYVDSTQGWLLKDK